MGSSFAEKWEELSGKDNWKGKLQPLDIDLRRYLIHYGDLSQVCGDTFISNAISDNNGASKYKRENLFTNCGVNYLNKYYRVTAYFYAVATTEKDNVKLKHQNWLGFIAVATDEGKVELGRREIVIAWRGSVQPEEWDADKDISQTEASIIFGSKSPPPMVHRGFYNIYTQGIEESKFNVTSSARCQIHEEVKKLIEEYKDEEVSITVTGHSLGAALATMTAVDIAFNKINQGFLVTAFPFACPMVGNDTFRDVFNQQDKLHCLKTRNSIDPVPFLPPLFYNAVGEELYVDTSKSPFLKPNGTDNKTNTNPHVLEIYIHGIAGDHGAGDFELVVDRDYKLMNKENSPLKDEYRIPDSWWIQDNKAMVQQEDGSWVFQDREPYPLPY